MKNVTGPDSVRETSDKLNNSSKSNPLIEVTCDQFEFRLGRVCKMVFKIKSYKKQGNYGSRVKMNKTLK